MSKLLHVDPIGGAAGDMLLAALLDAGAPEQPVRDAVEAVLPGRFRFRSEEVTRAGMRARMLRIEDGAAASPDASLEPRPFGELVAAVAEARMPSAVRSMSLSVLRRLGQAESRVHGLAPEDLEVHELGDDDTLFDVVAVTAALHALNLKDNLTVGTIPLGVGIHPAWRGHPEIPLPTTVALELLREFGVEGRGEGETITPTAAAILSVLAVSIPALPRMTVQSTGYGAGVRDPEGYPNVVRVVLGESAVAYARPLGGTERDLLVLEANVDDLSPELVADATHALFGAGALDVWTTPVHMKKGRSGVVISALCEPDAEERTRRTFFEATSTFGVRSTAVRRTELDRTVETVAVGDAAVRVKVGWLQGRVLSATPEHDDVAALADRMGLPVRVVYEEAAAAARALRYAPSET